VVIAVWHKHQEVPVSTLHNHHRVERGSVVALLAGITIAQAVAATSALQPAAPTALHQAQPAFGATTERPDASATAKKPEPLGLKPATGLGLKAEPALAPPNAAAKGALASKSNVSKAARNLFDMEDRAIIIVSGKQTTAGELKRKLHAEIAAKNGPPKTVKGGPRKLDLAALNVATSTKNAGSVAHAAVAKARLTPQAPVLLANQSLTQVHQSAKTTAGGLTIDKAGSYSSQKCLDKGPPAISEIRGSLKVGGQVEVWGRCFGDRPGRVEIIGQFPGGKLQAVFAAWDSGAVTIAIPGNVSGATDHAVAVSVVTAEGKVSPAMQAKFVAARARVEVPNRLWSPDNRLVRAETSEVPAPNPAQAGVLPRSLRVNPQCALDDMEVSVSLGRVGQIRGWDAGAPNEAAVSIDWTGSCTTTTTWKVYDSAFVGDDIVSMSSACRVAFEVRAWAYCPVGIAP
jgi:hypothetical protein